MPPPPTPTLPDRHPAAPQDGGGQLDGSSPSSAVPLLERPSGMALFSAAGAGYRTLRLGVELFLVEHARASGRPASYAGAVFVIYSVSDAGSALGHLLRPGVWFGSRRRGMAFVACAAGGMAGGFAGTFFARTVEGTGVAAVAMGAGAATWFVNYQTLASVSFSRLAMSRVAHARMGFECLGFLLPSACLAAVGTGAGAGDPAGSISACVAVLAVLGVLTFAASAPPVVSACAAAGRRTDDGSPSSAPARTGPGGLRADARSFVRSSVARYFGINAMVLAISNAFFASLSTITQRYFGLEASYLWIAAIGVPIGGISSSIFNLKGWFITGDDKQGVLNGSRNLFLLFLVLVLFSPLMEKNADTEAGGNDKATLFVLGLVIGFIYSRTYGSAYALWLTKLKDEEADFISRANVFHNVGAQLLVALTFQLQTVIIDASGGDSLNPMLRALLFFGPMLLMSAHVHYMATRVPFSSDPKFEWPIPTPFTFLRRSLIRVASAVGVGSLEGLAFGGFCDFRTALFGWYLEDAAVPSTPGEGEDAAAATRDAEDLEGFLRGAGFGGDVGVAGDAEGGGSNKDQWWTSSARLTHVLLSNHAAFRHRVRLIQEAKDSIYLATWSISGETGHLITDALINKVAQGVEVRVIVDAVNLYFEDEKDIRFGLGSGLFCLKRLVQAGVAVHMLDVWHERESKHPYVIGSHRKLMVVDEQRIMTGGRNLEDNYSRSENDQQFKFLDADVILEGDFSSSTMQLFEGIWHQARSIDVLLSRNFPDEFDDAEGQKELMAELSSDAPPISFRRTSAISKTFNKAWLQSTDGVQPSLGASGADSSATRAARTESDAASSAAFGSVESAEDRSSGGIPALRSRRRSTSSHLLRHTMNSSRFAKEGRLTNSMPIDFVKVPQLIENVDENVEAAAAGVEENLKEGVEVSLTQLDHKAGSNEDSDIVLSSLLFMIETAEKSVDLIFGYFQLFPVMRDALARAVSRGVKVRLITNSSKSNDVYFFNGVFRDAISHLLDMGAEILVPCDSQELCLHYKCTLIDSKSLLVGSWNMWGTSVFYDSEFSVVIRAEDGVTSMSSFVDDLIDAKLLVPLNETPPEWALNKVIKWASTKYALSQMARGY